MPARYVRTRGGYRAVGSAVLRPSVGGSLDALLERMRRACAARSPTLATARVAFVDLHAKAAYLAGAAREDSLRPEIVALASLVRRLPREARAIELYRFVRRSIRYIEDLDGEEFDDAVTSLLRGEDDCDGSARALVALSLAAGLEAAVRAVLSPDGRHLEHVQALLRWDDGPFVLAETTLAGVELGDGAEAGRVDEAGEYVTV